MLNTILSEIASDEGLSTANASERAWLVDQINKSAEEIYNSYDLRSSYREQIFSLGEGKQLITLPWYVANVRKIRNYDVRRNIKYIDMGQRYHTNDWELGPFFEYREVQKEAPLETNITNLGPLTVTLTSACTTAFTVIITGKTEDTERKVEMLTFLAGETTKTTANNYEDIESIRKNRVNDEDLSVSDLDGNVVARIPNHMEKSTNTIVEVLDYPTQQLGEATLVEVLYKHTFAPFVNDTDSLPCGDFFDRCIYWKTVSNIYTKREGQTAERKVLGAEAKFKKILEEMTSNDIQGREFKLDFGTNPHYGYMMHYAD